MKNFNEQKKNWLGKKTLFSAIAVLLILIISFLVFISYSGFSLNFIPRNLILSLDNTLATIPFVPKTTRQILVHSLDQTSKLTSYKIDTSLNLKTEKEQLFFFGLKGSINNAGSFTSSYKANLSVPQKDLTSVDLFEEDSNLYLKVNNPFVLPGLVIPKAKRVWYQVDFDSLQSSLKVSSREDGKIVEDIKNRLDANWQQINNSITKSSKLTEEKLANENVYKIQVNLAPKFVKDLLSDQFSLGQSEITFWISKGSFVIRKVNFSGNFKSNSDKDSNTLNVIYQLNPNEEKVEVPTGTKEIKNAVELWAELNLEDNNKSTESLLGAAQYSSEFGQNFVAFERIVKVIFLLPKGL